MRNETAKLFTDSYFFRRRQRRLPELIERNWTQIAQKNLGASNDALLSQVREVLSLRPVEIGEIRAISIESIKRTFFTDFGDPCERHRALAEVPFEGSPELWRPRPSVPKWWCVRGDVRPGMARLRYGWPDRNIEALEAHIEQQLAELRTRVVAFQPQIETFNQRLEALLQAKAEGSLI